MRYTLTLEFDTPAELLAYLAPAADAAPPPKKKAPVEEDDEPKAKAKKAAPAPEPDEEEGPDYETEVRPAVVKFSKDFGREAAAELLENYTNPATGEPATKGAEVAPADYPKLLARLAKKRKALEDAAE